MLALGLSAPAADALTYCVAKPSCVSAGGIDHGTDLQGALTAAAGNTGPDRLEIGAATISSSGVGFFYSAGAGNGLEVVGAGVDQTVITGDPKATPGQIDTLNLQGSGQEVSVRDLTVVARGAVNPGDIVTATGLTIIGRAERVNVIAAPDFFTGTGIHLVGILEDSSSAVPQSAGGSVGVRVLDGYVGTIRDSFASGQHGLYADSAGADQTTMNVRRTRVEGGETGISVTGSVANIDNSLIRGGNTVGVHAATTANHNADVALNHVTVVEGGVGLRSAASSSGRTASLTARNSLIEGIAAPLHRTAPVGTANLSIAYSNFTGAQVQNGPGSLSVGPGRTAFANPGFINPAAGNYDLKPSAAVRDRGDQTGLSSGESPTDLAGRGRIAGGRRDMGAFEYPSITRCAGRKATRVGTQGPDKIKGTAKRDIIAGLGGNDTIRGLAGNDVICGGSGRDRLIGAKGRDTLLGQGGKDILLGGPGRDRLIGGPGRDRLRGGPGWDFQRQ